MCFKLFWDFINLFKSQNSFENEVETRLEEWKIQMYSNNRYLNNIPTERIIKQKNIIIEELKNERKLN